MVDARQLARLNYLDVLDFATVVLLSLVTIVI